MSPDSNPLQPFADAPIPVLSLTSRLARTDEVAFQSLGEETVIVLPLTRTLHVLNPTGRFLWEVLDRPRSVLDLVDRLDGAYEVPRPQAEADVLAWAAELKRQRILVDG